MKDFRSDRFLKPTTIRKLETWRKYKKIHLHQQLTMEPQFGSLEIFFQKNQLWTISYEGLLFSYPS